MTCLSFALAVSIAAAPASAVVEVRAKLAALQFEATVQVAAAALAKGQSRPDETAELHFLSAQASAVLGRADEAADAFATALELAPGLSLPPGTSPKISMPYRAAKDRLGGVRLSTLPSGRLLSDGKAQVDVRIEGDVMQLVDRGELSFLTPAGPGAVPLSRTQVPQATFPCATPPCAFAVTLFDRPGNALLEVGSLDAPLFVDAGSALAVKAPENAETPALSVAQEPGRAWYRHPLTWGISAAVLAGVGAVFTARFVDANARVAAMDAARAQHRVAEVEAVSAQAQADRALLAGFFAGAAALGTVAIVVW